MTNRELIIILQSFPQDAEIKFTCNGQEFVATDSKHIFCYDEVDNNKTSGFYETNSTSKVIYIPIMSKDKKYER